MKRQMMVRIVSVLSVMLSILVLTAVLLPSEESTGIFYRVSGGRMVREK